MKVITWNCNMVFRTKAHLILKHKPDILIVPECEHPDLLGFSAGTPKPTDMLWFGKNKHKGLGIFSYCDFRFSVLDIHNEDLKLIVPIAVTGGNFDFTLFAIWAADPYIEEVWKAIRHYNALLGDTKTMLVGDFNSNAIWDKQHGERSHSNLVKLLEERKIFSSYHLHHKQKQGKEKHPTLYMYRHKDKPYHIDYCFISADMAKRLESVEVGRYNAWAKHSDHVPVIVTFKPYRKPRLAKKNELPPGRKIT